MPIAHHFALDALRVGVGDAPAGAAAAPLSGRPHPAQNRACSGIAAPQ
jgi:hypothetical protein